MKNGDMPAMPLALDIRDDGNGNQSVNGAYEGMTKREMIAMHAMQGFLSGMLADGSKVQSEDFGNFARASVRQADALLKELEK